MHTKTSKHAKPFSAGSIALFAGVIVLMAGGWLFAYVWHWQHRPRVLEIYCFSTGGASGTASTVAIFIRTPGGHTVLIDGGKSDTIMSDLTSVMPFYDRTIDEVILTDDDDAHATGLVSVLKRYRVGEVFEMDSPAAPASVPAMVSSTTSSSYATFENIAAEKNINDEKVGKEDTMSIGELTANVIFPPVQPISPEADNFKFSKTNMPTLAFTIFYGSTTLFFGGMLTKTEQKYVASGVASSSEETGPDISNFPTTLILPQGENVSTVDEGFFNTVHPQYVVVSKKPRSAGAFITATATKSPKETATTTKTGKIKKPPKPPFSIADVPNVSITNLVTDGDAEFISNGETFTEKKL